MARHLQTGMAGENAVLQYLQKRGYQLLERNWRYHRCEIDLIFLLGFELVFVEVKTRTLSSAKSEEQPGISPAQQERIFDAACAYAEKHEYQCEMRFDLATVLLAPDGYLLEINHYPNAFFPGMPFF